MQISSRFTVAVHILTCIAEFENTEKVTSDFLADSIQVNPVIIRNLLGKLKAAGLVAVKRGSGGASAAKPLESITFYDVYKAVECVDEEGLFHFHENPNPKCPVGRNIHGSLDGKLAEIQNAMEEKMREVTIADVVRDTDELIKNEGSLQTL